MLGRDVDEGKGAPGRGRSGDDGTADNNNNDDNDHCNDGLRYVRLALSDTHLANKIPCNLLPPPPPPPPQCFFPGPWMHYFKVRKKTAKFVYFILLLASRLKIYLKSSLKFSITVQEDVDHMEIHVPPELRDKPKRLPPKRNKRGGIGKLKEKIPDHNLYASTDVVAVPYLPVEVPAPYNKKN